MSSSFELSGSFCSGKMKYICSICRTLEVSLIQITQVTRPWGYSCHPETSKLHTGNIGAILWEYFPILEDSRSITPNYLMHICLNVEHYDIEQVAWLNSECCYMAVRYKERFSQLKSSIGLKVIAPIHTAWDNGYFIIALHQKNVVCCIYCMASLSLRHNPAGEPHVHCKHTHTFFRFLNFTNMGSFLKVTPKLMFCLIIISNTMVRPGLWICLLTSELSLR